ncbi:MAG: 3-isopropylmalate dehydrogenase [Myxococcales bacterium]|nr:3-isopropylmalate dehydrogenase [Myxococcales bacterium]
MQKRIVLLPGDGIGPEIVREARRVLDSVAVKFGHSFEFQTQLIGGAAIDEKWKPLPDETLAACKASDAVLLGAVGGPKWDDPGAKVRPEQGLLGIRKGLDLFANLRPVKVMPGLEEASPLKPDRIKGVDILVVRELTGDVYFGEPRLREETPNGVRALDTMVYFEHEVERVVELAMKLSKGRTKKVTSIDKANVLDCSRLWRAVVTRVASEFPDVKLEHQLVDSAAMRLVTQPSAFDVIVTGNLFGDILSDEAAVLTGSLGVLPSASLGGGTRGLYEPIHGSAPDIAGKGVANPLGTILSTAMLLRHSLHLPDCAAAVESAVEKVMADKCVTADLGGSLSTAEVGDAVVAALA